MRTDEFDYDLPERLIAQTPLEDRSAARLLVLHKATGETEHRTFRDLLGYLDPTDLLVMNETRVTALRLSGERSTGGKVEALLLRSLGGGTYEALVRPAKKLRPGEVIRFEQGLEARVAVDLSEGKKTLFFEQEDFERRIMCVGRVPLPPYIHTELHTPERYQTVYSTTPGSAAAPTAGLHFTPEMLAQVATLGVTTARVSLDVGLDTFRPVASENIEDHKIHGETCRVDELTAKAVASSRGRVIAVGTTTVRTLESFASGRKLLTCGERDSRLFITPGFDFQIVDAMLTNFHMPRTTMLMMVAAMTGREALMKAYREAVVENYRFLSFGDAMLVM